ncbi:MAG: hypothetical protein NTU44_19115 [Bacteroidetes bacterium]|nr:hypothetical protein [Bacteroidota bacterium]
MKRVVILCLFASLALFSSSCVKDETPTKTRMQGVWEVTAAYDENNADILSKVSVPVAAFHLSDDNTVVSTGGPAIMYVVYGGNKYTTIAGSLDQFFKYATLSFSGGEFFVGGGVVDRFTLEMKLQGIPGQMALTTLLDMLGITQDWLDVVVYHKFMDVKVTFNYDNSQMTWEFDNTTKAVYNTKDNYGNYVSWLGWPVTNFSHCRFILTKRSTSLNDLVSSHH